MSADNLNEVSLGIVSFHTNDAAESVPVQRLMTATTTMDNLNIHHNQILLDLFTDRGQIFIPGTILVGRWPHGIYSMQFMSFY